VLNIALVFHSVVHQIVHVALQALNQSIVNQDLEDLVVREVNQDAMVRMVRLDLADLAERKD